MTDIGHATLHLCLGVWSLGVRFGLTALLLLLRRLWRRRPATQHASRRPLRRLRRAELPRPLDALCQQLRRRARPGTEGQGKAVKGQWKAAKKQ